MRDEWRSWLPADAGSVQVREINKANEALREQADKATTWAELPEAYRDMVLADLGDFGASCRVRDWVHVRIFEESKARKLAADALRAVLP
jgi:hypothetical protein